MRNQNKYDTKKKSLRIKSRSRFFTSVMLCLFMFVSMFNMAINLSLAHTNKTVEHLQIEIKAGDCLWNIAKKYAPAHMDPRKAVHEICELNDIEAHEIVAGQTLLIPYYQ